MLQVSQVLLVGFYADNLLVVIRPPIEPCRMVLPSLAV